MAVAVCVMDMEFSSSAWNECGMGVVSALLSENRME